MNGERRLEIDVEILTEEAPAGRRAFAVLILLEKSVSLSYTKRIIATQTRRKVVKCMPGDEYLTFVRRAGLPLPAEGHLRVRRALRMDAQAYPGRRCCPSYWSTWSRSLGDRK